VLAALAVRLVADLKAQEVVDHQAVKVVQVSLLLADLPVPVQEVVVLLVLVLVAPVQVLVVPVVVPVVVHQDV
jgi:hypothetical protein